MELMNVVWEAAVIWGWERFFWKTEKKACSVITVEIVQILMNNECEAVHFNPLEHKLTVNIQNTYCWWCFYFKTLSFVSFDEIKSNGWLLVISVCLFSSSCVCDNKEQHVICLSPAGLSKNTCSRFHGFINKTVQQSMKTAFFSAQSHWLSLSCCVAAIILRALALCFAFVCVCTIFCVLLQISSGLFRNVFAGRRGRRAFVCQCGC